MNQQAFSLGLLLLGFQAVRFGLLSGFLATRAQGYVLYYVMIATAIEIFVLKKIYAGFGLKGERFQRALNSGVVSVVGFVLCLCSTALAGSIPLAANFTNGIPHGEFQGETRVEQLPMFEEGCFELKDGRPVIDYLGAVKYSLTSRVRRFFYAIPFETANWTPDKEVRVWAILSESDLEQNQFQSNRFAIIVPTYSVDYAAYRAAAQNAEERFAIRSSEQFVLVRLLPEIPTQTGFQALGIGLIYLLGWICSIPFILRATTEPDPETSTSEVTKTRETSGRPAYLLSRKYWFAIHVLGYLLLALWLCQSTYPWLAFLLAFLLPGLEIWLVTRAPTDRQSGRFALMVWLMPLGLFFSMPLLGIGALNFAASREAGAARPIETIEELLPKSGEFAPSLDLTKPTSPPTKSTLLGREIVELGDDFVLREDLSGLFWAPTETSRYRRLIPVVERDWASDRPIRIWIETTDRNDPVQIQDSQDEDSLRYVRRSSFTNDLRRTQAIRDSLVRNNLLSDPDALILERVRNPEHTSSEGGGMIVLGFFGCLMTWGICACFWPRVQTPEQEIAVRTEGSL